jgi:hypothetical protein
MNSAPSRPKPWPPARSSEANLIESDIGSTPFEPAHLTNAAKFHIKSGELERVTEPTRGGRRPSLFVTTDHASRGRRIDAARKRLPPDGRGRGHHSTAPRAGPHEAQLRGSLRFRGRHQVDMEATDRTNRSSRPISRSAFRAPVASARAAIFAVPCHHWTVSPVIGAQLKAACVGALASTHPANRGIRSGVNCGVVNRLGTGRSFQSEVLRAEVSTLAPR